MTCKVEDCPKKVNSRGLCSAHYAQWWKAQGKRLNPKSADRAWAKCLNKIDATGDCWQWLGTTDHAGYGRFVSDGHLMAHRYVWTKLVGPIAPGLTLDHLCRNRGCVNPDHLEPVPFSVNVNRGRTISVVNRRKTHCLNGHEFTVENIYRNGPRGRTCKTCALRRADERRARLRAAI